MFVVISRQDAFVNIFFPVIDDLCSEGHISSDPPTVDDLFAPAADPHHPVVITNASEQKSDHADLQSATQAYHGSRPGASSEDITKAGVKTSLLSMKSLAKPAVGHTPVNSVVQSDNEFHILSALPSMSANRARAKKRKIPVRSDTNSDGDMKDINASSGIAAVSLSMAVPHAESHKALDPAPAAMASTGAADVTHAESVSDISEPETCESMAEPEFTTRVSSRHTRQHSGNQASQKKPDNGALENPDGRLAATKDIRAPQMNPDPTKITMKRKREPANKSEPLEDPNSPVLNLVPRKKRLRQQNEQQKTLSAPSPEPTIGSAVTRTHEIPTRKVSPILNNILNSERASNSDMVGGLRASSKSVKPKYSHYFPNRHRASTAEDRVPATSLSVKNEIDPEVPATKKVSRTERREHSIKLPGAGQTQPEPEKDAVKEVSPDC